MISSKTNHHKTFKEEWSETSGGSHKFVYLTCLGFEILFGVYSVIFAIKFSKSLEANPDPTLSYFVVMVMFLVLTIVVGRINISPKKEDKNDPE
jgi:heme A synthase